MIVYGIFREDTLYCVELNIGDAYEKRDDLDKRYFGLFTVRSMKIEEVKE